MGVAVSSIQPLLIMSEETEQIEIENPFVVDPYQSIAEELKSRVSVDLPTRDKQLIQGVCPIRGILQGMINSFILSVVTEMRAKKITFNDSELGGNNYERFIELISKRISPDDYIRSVTNNFQSWPTSLGPTDAVGRLAAPESHRDGPVETHSGGKVSPHKDVAGTPGKPANNESASGESGKKPRKKVSAGGQAGKSK